MKSIRVVAPAKVNLFLGIGEHTNDGYHQATTVMHALALHDTICITRLAAGETAILAEPGDAAQPIRELEVTVEPGSGLAVSARMIWTAGLDPVAVSDDNNLACKAVRALAEALGRTEDEYIRLIIEKNIPHQTGLGGGSADAAAALVGMADLWDVSDTQVVEDVAKQLGADVAFFLHGGCSLLEGRGDEFVHDLQPRRDTVLLVKPAGGVPTAQAYATFDTNPSLPNADLIEQLYACEHASGVPLFNNLAEASEVLHDQLAEVRTFLQKKDEVTGVLLCGSGAGTFAVCKDFAAAQHLAAEAQARGWWARATSFSPLKAALLPDR